MTQLVRLVGLDDGRVVGVFPWASTVVDVDDVPGDLLTVDPLGILSACADAFACHVAAHRGEWYVIGSTAAGDLVGVTRTGGER